MALLSLFLSSVSEKLCSSHSAVALMTLLCSAVPQQPYLTQSEADPKSLPDLDLQLSWHQALVTVVSQQPYLTQSEADPRFLPDLDLPLSWHEALIWTVLFFSLLLAELPGLAVLDVVQQLLDQAVEVGWSCPNSTRCCCHELLGTAVGTL